jgi:Na+-driven multidrug efflux pump
MVMIMDLSRFAYITAIGTLADSLISLISLITVSRLSTIAIAATGIVSYLFFVINAASMIFTGGLMVLIFQAVGEGKLKLAENASAETLSLAIVSSLIALVSMPTWLKPYLELVSMGNTEILSESCIYASMGLLSLPAMREKGWKCSSMPHYLPFTGLAMTLLLQQSARL